MYKQFHQNISPDILAMFNSSQFAGKDLEVLVRTALAHGELSPGVAVAIESYREKSNLSRAEKRQLEILGQAIADGCIVPVPSQYAVR